MLSRRELEEIARTVSYGNVGHAETLYLQDIVLSTVSRETVDELVFKGGTALLKCYQLDRFSEDLDFTLRGELDLSELLRQAQRDLELYGATVAERTVEETDDAYHARLGIEGPLYMEDRRSACFIRLEINKRSTVSRFRTVRYTPPFRDIASLDLVVLAEAEILAEKIRALCTRRRPRDLYDAFHLLERSTSIEPALVQEKLDYYDLAYDPDDVLAGARQLENGWASIEPLVYGQLPAFQDVMSAFERHVGSTTDPS